MKKILQRLAFSVFLVGTGLIVASLFWGVRIEFSSASAQSKDQAKDQTRDAKASSSGVVDVKPDAKSELKSDAKGDTHTYAKKIWTDGNRSEIEKKNANVDIFAQATALNKTFIELAEKLSPTVVNVYTKTRMQRPRMQQFGGDEDMFRFFFGNPFYDPNGGQRVQESQALGSGFVINADGYIITNSHVVRPNGRNADEIMVKFLNDPKNSPGSEAQVVGVDETTDVALLKLKKRREGLKAAALGDSDRAHVGEWTIAIGNPYGHTNTVTQGIVSALARDLEQSRAEFIQTSASINPGNSGGPLFNLYGEVIGINTAIDARAQGIGFAIPINTAKGVISQLVDKGEVSVSWLGVGTDNLNPKIAKQLGISRDVDGAVVVQVVAGGPAEKGGLRAYDVITEVNGRKISDARELQLAVGNIPVGTKAEIKVIREGKAQSLAITIGNRKDIEKLAKQDKHFGSPFDQGPRPEKRSQAQNKVGLSLEELSSDVRRELGLDSRISGVLVRKVDRTGLGSEAGLAPGDVITEINKQKVKSVKEAEKLFAVGADTYMLRVQRGRASLIIVLDQADHAKGGSEDEESEEEP